VIGGATGGRPGKPLAWIQTEQSLEQQPSLSMFRVVAMSGTAGRFNIRGLPLRIGAALLLGLTTGIPASTQVRCGGGQPCRLHHCSQNDGVVLAGRFPVMADDPPIDQDFASG